MSLSAVILAAGLGTRMKSALPKVVHPVAGRPMILYGVESARNVGADPIVLIVGYGAGQVKSVVGDSVTYAMQPEQLGTGHALMQAEPLLRERTDTVLVYYGDMPLLRPETLEDLLRTHRDEGATLTLLTLMSKDSMGFGRIVRDSSGHVQRIVEDALATPAQKHIHELNCGVYCFEANWLWETLPQLKPSPKGEYFLTDLLELAVRGELHVAAMTIEDTDEALGINDRTQLAQAEASVRRRIAERHMLNGVTLVDPRTTYIGAEVEISPDTVVHPNTHLQGQTIIGWECCVGPNTIVRNSHIGNRCRVEASVVEGALLEDDVSIGPFAHLREKAHLGPGVHMGNFGEVKNSHLGAGTKMGHFSYVGDATVGAGVNIGAGTVTCNYDGEQKHPTIIEDGVFVGSDTMLVAPVRIGKRSKIGAGSVVTHDVPPDSVVYGVPARARSSKSASKQKASEGKEG